MTKMLEKTLILPGGLEIAYAEQGDRRGPALIIVHGYTDSHRASSRLMAELPEWMRVIAITLRGHGDSTKAISTYRTREHAEDLACVMDALAIGRAVIAGHSMGSMVAQRFALDFAERTAGLVLLGAFRTLRGNPMIEQMWRETLSTLVDPVDPAMVRAFQESTIEKPVPPAFLDMAIAESLKVPAFVWRAAARAQLEEDASAELGSIAARAMFVWGDRDSVSSHDEQRALAAALRNAELHVLAGVGHALHWEEPKAVARLIARFVSEQALPQAGGELFLTDGGLETTLIFHEGIELPHFAAFVLLEQNRAALERYYERYLAIAGRAGAGFILESPTWRCSSDWGHKLGLDDKRVFELNCDAIALMHELRAAHAARYPSSRAPIVVSGCVGPRGDGYDPGQAMTAEDAEAYHGAQISAFREARADMITAITMTNTPEAIGIARAARKAGLPVALSFTLETDGRLPTGQTLKSAIEEVDAATGYAPAYYMINCAHPTHFMHVLEPGAAWSSRIRGLRTNASKRSHQELNDSPDLDAGNPIELGTEHRELLHRHPHIHILGGCCGTDHRHIESIHTACR